MVHSLKKQFGIYSIFIMMIPYCMIHFGKPMSETLGAIFAGIILGALSLKSNSIWLGVLLHFSVAIAMDCFALLHR
jgi:membrane protease YdiL (CAAX protease family)